MLVTGTGASDCDKGDRQQLGTEHFRVIRVALKRAVKMGTLSWGRRDVYFPWAALADDFLGRSTAWMFGRTPPWAIVTPDNSLFNSSSLRMAS